MPGAPAPGKRPKPWFVAGFLAVGIFNTAAFHVFPNAHPVLHEYNAQILVIANFLMAMAMAGMGLQVDFGRLRANGPRAFAAAIVSWLALAGFAAIEIALLA